MTESGILPGGAALGAGRMALRGLAQVVFQPDARAGALFLAALALASPALALGGFAGALVAGLIAGRAGAPRAEVEAGLHGFNGALAGIALALFPGAGLGAGGRALLVLGGAALAAWLCLRLAPRLARARLPVLTAPFNLMALPVLALVHLRTGPLSAPEPEPDGMLLALLRGTVNGLSQVFFAQGMWPGLLIALGLAVAAPRVLALAVAASGGGAALALALGAGAQAVAAGLHGYNGVLVVLALGAVFLAPGRGVTALALAAALVVVPVQMGIAGALGVAGLPGLTVGFVLVSWAGLRVADRLGFARG